MTDEEILEIGMQAGMNQEIMLLGRNFKLLKQFAKLVEEKEREACIKIVMQGTEEPIQRKTLDILQQERTRIALAIKGQE